MINILHQEAIQIMSLPEERLRIATAHLDAESYSPNPSYLSTVLGFDVTQITYPQAINLINNYYLRIGLKFPPTHIEAVQLKSGMFKNVCPIIFAQVFRAYLINTYIGKPNETSTENLPSN